MSKETGFLLLKQKITLGYFILVVLALVAIGILYNGVQNILSIDKDISIPNQKLYLTNEILTLIYDAEADARSYYLFRKKQDLDHYVLKLGEIKTRIDKSFTLCYDNFQQIKSLQKIKELSIEQQGVIHKLISFDQQNEQNLIYKRALDEIYIQAYEIIPPTRVIRQNTIIRRDSVYKTPEKSGFFGKVKNLFSGTTTTGKEPGNIQIEKVTTSDTVVQTRPLPDSVVKLMKTSLDKLKMRDNYLKSQAISNETQLLHSDRVILDKIREIVASLETEELQLSTENINHSKSIVGKTVISVVWLGGISFVLIVLFIFLIFRDIAKNKRYNLALQVAKKNSEELVRVKEQFLAMMSHEIRTPLSSIIGFSEQLDKTRLDEKQGLYLDRIRKSSDFLLNLVNDILDLSKINADKIVLDKVRFNLAEVIREVYLSFAIAAQTKQIEFTCTCDPVVEREVYGDPLRFRQILMNLTGNAIKFTEKGSVKIVATSSGEVKDKLNVKVTISDTGVGIPKEKQPLIFEEFAQADGSITRKFGGTGLGLAIAHKIVKIFGGNIAVSSAPGEGSIFTVDLDFEIAVKHTDKAIITEKDGCTDLLKNKKILVVDDDETLLLLVSSMLANLEVSADTAVNGQEALSKLAAHTYDLIFTDLNMPEMNGLELMKMIKATNAQVPVVAITANSVVDSKYRDSGFAGFLPKPFKEADFSQKIYNVLFSHLEKIDSNGFGNYNSHNVNDRPYSLDEITQFIGNEPETIRKIIKSFVVNSLLTIKEMHEMLPSGNFEAISGKAHKLIPLFKQFHLFEIVVNLEKMERFRELNIPEKKLIDITKTVIDASEKVIHTIESDWLTSEKET